MYDAVRLWHFPSTSLPKRRELTWTEADNRCYNQRRPTFRRIAETKNIKLGSESRRQSNRCCNSQSACVRGFWSLLDGGCSYLWVDAEVFSGRKGQSEEVVALSGLFAIKLHQLSQLLHDLNRRRNIRYKFWWFKAISPSYCFKLYSNCLILTLQMTEP